MKNFVLNCLYFLIPFLFLFSKTSSAQDSVLCRNPSVIFCSGFEEGSKSIWDDRDENPDSTNLLLLEPGPFQIPGNHVMRLHVPPGRGGADLVKVLPSTYDKLYMRWYQQWEKGYDFTAANHGSGMYGGSRDLLGMSGNRPHGNDFFISTFEPLEGKLNLYTYYPGMYMDCANPDGACWGDHFPCWFDEGQRICEKPEHRDRLMPPVMEAGRWYCLEMMIDAGTPRQSDSLADGSLNFWIDGIEYGPWNNLWFRTTPNLRLSILWFMLFHHGNHSDAGILLDNIVVSTTKIGCGEPAGSVDDKISSKENSIIIRFNENTVTLNPGINPETDNELLIYNLYGTIVLSDVYPANISSITIDIAEFSPGIYFLILNKKFFKFVKT